jgi:hypothetical protein
MPAYGQAFVTPHAVRQFQSRIAPLPYRQALAAIITGLASATNSRPTSNGRAQRVRVRRPHAFRAIVRPPADGKGHLPIVVTILRSRH